MRVIGQCSQPYYTVEPSVAKKTPSASPFTTTDHFWVRAWDLVNNGRSRVGKNKKTKCDYSQGGGEKYFIKNINYYICTCMYYIHIYAYMNIYSIPYIYFILCRVFVIFNIYQSCLSQLFVVVRSTSVVSGLI